MMDFSPATPPLMSFADRLQWLVLHGVLRLPSAAKRRLAGPPSSPGAAPLALEAAVLIALTSRAGFSLVVDDSAAASRAALRKGANALRGTRLPVTAADITIPSGTGGIGARLNAPVREHAEGTLLLFLHGGGWALGDLDVYDYPSRFLAHHAGMRVLALDYRLAPEFPYPADLDDATDAFRWIVRHAAELGVAPDRIAVGGDSAGATVSASLSHRLGRATPTRGCCTRTA